MCSITGYGQDGPYASRAGHDLNYMAIAGALGLNGERDGPPVPLSVQVADIGGGGVLPAGAVLRGPGGGRLGGGGWWVDAALTDAALGGRRDAFAAPRAGGRRGARG